MSLFKNQQIVILMQNNHLGPFVELARGTFLSYLVPLAKAVHSLPNHYGRVFPLALLCFNDKINS